MVRKHPSRIPTWTWAALAAIFFFRLVFGFHANMDFNDQFQSYLIGLKYHCTGLWPYFGLDVTRGIQLPGALLGLLIGLPFKVWAVPEAPFLAVNLFSFSGLCLFAWYACKRLPLFPAWVIWGWSLTAPWVLNCSTNVHSLSFIPFGGVLFLLGFLESVPALSRGILRPWLANFLMGSSLLWCAQFHMSYPILLPLIAFSAWVQARAAWKGRTWTFLRGAGAFFLGTAASGIFILPTLLHYGMEGLGGTQNALRFNPSNFTSFFTILARFLSLASCEVPRFLGPHTADRWAFLQAMPWASPFVLFAFALGILQPILMLAAGFRKAHPQKDWKAVKTLVLSTFLLIYTAFLFAIKVPAAHTYYLFLPMVMLYAFYVFLPWARTRWFKVCAGMLLVCNLVLHLALGIYNREERSLYTFREKVEKALQEKDYRLMGERRPGTRY